jgi:hypothetical protein
MKTSLMRDQTSLLHAEEALREEHRTLEQLMELLQTAKDVPELASAADELRQALIVHFAREEHPGGYYDSLRLCVPEHRGDLAQLVDDHRQIGLALWQLYRRAREVEAQVEELRTEVAQLVMRLREHETREHEIVHQLLEI